MAISISQKTLFMVNVFTLFGTMALSYFILLPLLLQMVLYTFPIIYIASHQSVKSVEEPHEIENVSTFDVLLMPFLGSAVLLLLYALFTYFDPYWVNLLLKIHLTLWGILAVAETFKRSLDTFIPDASILKSTYSVKLHLWPIGTGNDSLILPLSAINVFCSFLGVAVGFGWFFTHSWLLHNFLAVAFCIQAVSCLFVGDFTKASLLLAGLFIYDIWWVFGTQVMVIVAKAVDGPAKLIFPTSFDPWAQFILGLGDIIVPGIFISLCLRFDFWIHSSKIQAQNERAKMLKKDASANEESPPNTDENLHVKENRVENLQAAMHQPFSKFYFWVVLLSYELGLLTTGIVMLFVKHPQPALLYLVPYCIFSFYGAAILNGDMKFVFDFFDGNGTSPTNFMEDHKKAE